MEDSEKESQPTRRSVLQRAGGAVGASLGIAASSGAVSATGDDDVLKDCPKCDEEKGGPTRYKIAHRPPGNPDKCIELCLPKPAAKSHLKNHPDDTCGPCKKKKKRKKKGKKKKKKRKKKGKKKKKKRKKKGKKKKDEEKED
ncbi:hypothetical protein ACFQMA_11920 [Halosimplex aquaticum]|uniref:Tat (Twin-arginine translocation) pathway signal sequence n=1 Tax=Halosimplex aquaticum TaxID=3026162 RepID=A0ABD5Y4E2_9EURY|nr:hypothetical protein [Halosimplex aquaticum]